VSKENTKISDARIRYPDLNKPWNQARVEVQVSGTWSTLFSFYHDELSFNREEFIGKTIEDGHNLFTKKDIAYLQD
jgi:hypothetical protein